MFARKDNSICNTSPSPTRPLLCSEDGHPPRNKGDCSCD